jgi:transcriptional regulator with XRE-family HTH domain
MQTFGERLQQIRTNAGLTVRELAARANLPGVLIYAYENSRTSPTFQSVEVLAAPLGVELTEFARCLLPSDRRRRRARAAPC